MMHGFNLHYPSESIVPIQKCEAICHSTNNGYIVFAIKYVFQNILIYSETH